MSRVSLNSPKPYLRDTAASSIRLRSLVNRQKDAQSTSFGTSPYGGATYGGSAAPSSLNLGGREDLGNAGTFTPGGAAGAAAGQTLRAPGPVLREGPGFFSGSAS